MTPIISPGAGFTTTGNTRIRVDDRSPEEKAGDARR
jgi:hypothetical protein